jgi:hypothetical protein
MVSRRAAHGRAIGNYSRISTSQHDECAAARLLRRAGGARRAFIAFSRWTRSTFAIYGAALLPFFWFNYYFVFVVPVMTRLMAIDLVSNLFMLGLCVWGYRIAPARLVAATD